MDGWMGKILGVDLTARVCTEEALDPHQWKGKAKVTKAYQDLSAIIDSAGLCIFFAVRNLVAKDLGVAPVGILEYLNAATDADYSLEELMRSGERIINAERLFLTRAGFTRKDDSLPQLLTDTPAPTGPAKGLVCHLDEMLDEYYEIQEWTEDCIPMAKRLKHLGLSKLWKENDGHKI
jgi:aldehyde:ferredoxin oxidoreductase